MSRDMKRKESLQEIAARMKKLRQTLGLSQERMAAHFGITRTSYTRYERAMSMPAVSALTVLAENFAVSLDWLLANKGPMFYNEKMQPQKRSSLDNVMEDIKELLDHMERIPLLRYEVLSFFHRFKVENRDLVESTPHESPEPGSD